MRWGREAAVALVGTMIWVEASETGQVVDEITDAGPHVDVGRYDRVVDEGELAWAVEGVAAVYENAGNVCGAT